MATYKRPVHALGSTALHVIVLLLVMFFLFLGTPGRLRADSFLKALGGDGGGQFIAYCPAGQNLTGFELRAADDVDAIRPVCVVSYSATDISAPPLTKDSGLVHREVPGSVYGIEVLAPGWYGGTGGQIVQVLCPASTPIVIGMDVAAEGADTVVVNNIHLFCGRAVTGQTPPSSPSAIFDAPRYKQWVMPTPVSQRCPADQVAIGVHGRSGIWLDAVGLICATRRLDSSGPGVKSLGKKGSGLTSNGPLAPHPPVTLCEAARAARARNSPAAPNLEAQCRATSKPVASIGRLAPSEPSGPPVPVCDQARAARARNSPAASNLEAQCAARGGGQSLDRPADPARTPDELAAAGEIIANSDTLSAALRNQFTEGSLRRGFDIGMAAAEGQTAWGPGKQKILASLTWAEQEGFEVAISFSLDRNRNAALAAIGAAIAEADPTVAQARSAEPDVRYWLGFDIATGIFGDPAQGANGNTATGPGSMKIRDALSAPAQRGFNASVKLHLSRHY